MGYQRFSWNTYKKMQKIIIPDLKFSQLQYEETLKEYVDSDSLWLDLGCGHQILPQSRKDKSLELVKNSKGIVGIDGDFDSLKEHKEINLKVLGNINNLPFKDESFRLVTANMVVEHFENAKNQFREISRIIEPGGYFIFHTPNSSGYMAIISKLLPQGLKEKLIYILEGREEKDVYPTFYQVNSKKNIESIFKEAGFSDMKLKMIVSDAELHIFPPAAFLELLWIKLLKTNLMSPFRPNIIAILQKEIKV